MTKKTARRRTSTCIATSTAPEPTNSDQKILWARAAGRCSICKTKLTHDSDKPHIATLGEMCHIVGEKRTSPRGKDGLPIEDRGRYSNLILLCRHHHRKVDVSEAEHTVAILHRIKDDHERWVEEQLTQTADPDDEIYADWIDAITQHLLLDRWHSFSDNAVRLIVPDELLDVRGLLNTKMLATLWPRKHLPFERQIRCLVCAFDRWITLYSENARLWPLDGNTLRPDRSYLHRSYELMVKGEQEENEWATACFWLFSDFVIQLNRYARLVRATLNPLYFRRRGKFLIFDDMGVWSGGQPTVIEPIPHVVKKGISKYVPFVEKRVLGRLRARTVSPARKIQRGKIQRRHH